MGIVPQCKLRDCWQAKNVITQTPAFHQVMSKNHWCAIWTLRLPEIKKFLLYILQWALCLSATRTASSASNKPMFTPSALSCGNSPIDACPEVAKGNAAACCYS